MDYTSFLYDDDIATESIKDKIGGTWEKIQNAFQAMIDWCREKIAIVKEQGLKVMLGSVLKDVRDFFTKAKRDRENAHGYLGDARKRVDEAKARLKASKEDDNATKEDRKAARQNLREAKSAYRKANRISKKQRRQEKAYYRQMNKGNGEKAQDRLSRIQELNKKGNDAVYGNVAESYGYEDYDDADWALEAALADVDIYSDPSVAEALENMETNIAINCTTAEECANIMDGLNDQIDAFNRHISTLRVATENYMEDQDKEAFQVTTRNAMAALESSYDALGLVSESGRFDEACIEQLHNFFDGASQIMADKAEEFEYEDDVFGASESFLGALVQ